ncbi:MAG: PEP-CTERM sorting domain-containing protein [Fibrella sp.]|nr:PEP-CTERM sorting domain-containing protein [Armatimonadota bacterium]
MTIPTPINLIRSTLALVALLATTPVFAQLNYTFDANAEGWLAGSRPNGSGNPSTPPLSPLTPNGNVTFSYVAAGGNPGGHVRVADTGGGDAILYRNFAGGTNLSSLLNATFRFDARLFSGTTSNYGPFGRVRFYTSDGALPNSSTDDQGAAFDIAPGTTSPLSTSWSTYSAVVSNANFTVFSPSPLTLTQVLSNVIRIEITTESIQGFDETVGVDNIRFAAVPEPATIALLGMGIVGIITLRRRRRA